MRLQATTFRRLVAAIFIAAGILHFVAADQFASIVPDRLPRPDLLVYVSGLAELAGGIGLLLERTRRLAALGLTLLLFAVWPANFQMLVDAGNAGASAVVLAGLWLRLPLQLLVIVWVLRAGEVIRPR